MLLTAWSDYPVITIHWVISQVRKQEWRRRLEERQQLFSAEGASLSKAVKQKVDHPSVLDSPCAAWVYNSHPPVVFNTDVGQFKEFPAQPVRWSSSSRLCQNCAMRGVGRNDAGPLDIYTCLSTGVTLRWGRWKPRAAWCSVASSLAYVPLRRISAVCTRLKRRLDIIIAKLNPGWLFFNFKIRSVRMMTNGAYYKQNKTKRTKVKKKTQKKTELSHRCSIPFHGQPERRGKKKKSSIALDHREHQINYLDQKKRMERGHLHNTSKNKSVTI